VQHANGVIDILVDDEAQAVAAARHYLSFFQGRVEQWSEPDQRLLRQVVPENRLRAYDTRAAMAGLVDEGSLLMLRTGFGAGIHTALARIEAARGPDGQQPGPSGRRHRCRCGRQGGALHAAVQCPRHRHRQPGRHARLHGRAGDRENRPGAPCQPAVRHGGQAARPYFSVVLRKGYGLGAMGMTAGSFHAPIFTVAWPTGEFGAMGLEGAVRLGFRKELEALPEGAQREALFQKLLAQQYAHGEAMHMAATLEVDAVIDPAETRAWLVRGLAGARLRDEPARFVDTW
jgi:acetyl-CoA carboxylase carboxyltransferase component